MSGNNESFAQTKWDEFNKAIQQYLDSLGINKMRYNPEVEAILQYDRSKLSKLTQQQIAEDEFLLAQYMVCLQKEINAHSTKLLWAEHNMAIIVARECGKYGTQYSKYDERRELVKLADTHAKVLNIMVLEAGARVKQLEFIATKVATMKQALSDLIKVKNYYDK